MTVQPVEFERLRFWVESETHPGVVHLVDLDDDGQPGCSCHDFMCRGHLCKHIRAAAAFLRTCPPAPVVAVSVPCLTPATNAR